MPAVRAIGRATAITGRSDMPKPLSRRFRQRRRKACAWYAPRHILRNGWGVGLTHRAVVSNIFRSPGRHIHNGISPLLVVTTLVVFYIILLFFSLAVNPPGSRPGLGIPFLKTVLVTPCSASQFSAWSISLTAGHFFHRQPVRYLSASS